MNRTKQYSQILSIASLLVMCGSTPAATYEFDLLQKLGSGLEGIPEAVVELGVEFSTIDSASVRLAGEFTPGLARPVTIPPGVGPTSQWDQFHYTVGLGETGSDWINKDVY